MSTEIQRFLRANPVFTYETFLTTISKNGHRNPHTVKTLLTYHIRCGNILRIRRGLFAAVPVGADPKTYLVNPYLIAAYATEDAVIAYHTALDFHGAIYSTSYRFIYLTKHRSGKFNFRSETYESVIFSPALIEQNQEESFVNVGDIQGLNIKVTSLERTIVDVLDKPVLSGGWEEVWRSLELIEHIKVKNIIDYALVLNKATTIAKVGFYLTHCRKDLNIKQEDLERLRLHCPLAPHYMDPSARHNGKFFPEWNIIVQNNLLMQNWQE